MAMSMQSQRMASTADTGIDHDQVDCSFGKSAPAPPQQVGCGPDIARGDLMGQIDQNG
jgi:hypothetical protein